MRLNGSGTAANQRRSFAEVEPREGLSNAFCMIMHDKSVGCRVGMRERARDVCVALMLVILLWRNSNAIGTSWAKKGSGKTPGDRARFDQEPRSKETGEVGWQSTSRLTYCCDALLGERGTGGEEKDVEVWLAVGAGVYALRAQFCRGRTRLEG